MATLTGLQMCMNRSTPDWTLIIWACCFTCCKCCILYFFGINERLKLSCYCYSASISYDNVMKPIKTRSYYKPSPLETLSNSARNEKPSTASTDIEQYPAEAPLKSEQQGLLSTPEQPGTSESSVKPVSNDASSLFKKYVIEPIVLYFKTKHEQFWVGRNIFRYASSSSLFFR